VSERVCVYVSWCFSVSESWVLQTFESCILSLCLYICLCLHQCPCTCPRCVHVRVCFCLCLYASYSVSVHVHVNVVRVSHFLCQCLQRVVCMSLQCDVCLMSVCVCACARLNMHACTSMFASDVFMYACCVYARNHARIDCHQFLGFLKQQASRAKEPSKQCK